MITAGKRYILYPSRSSEITIYNLSDWHLLNKACARKRLEADIEAIRTDPGAFWLGGGDYAEYISPTDPRFDATCIGDELTPADFGSLGMKSMETVAKLARPIANKCLGMLLGNHEKKYQKRNEQEFLHAYLCKMLGVPDLGYSALLDVVFRRMMRRKRITLTTDAPDHSQSCQSWTQRVYIHHGAGGATTPGGKLNRLIQFMHMFEADIYMIGHVHDQKGQRLVSIGANPACTELVEREKVGIISGSYLRTYAEGVTTYGEEKAYAPVPIGASFVRIRPDKREVTAEI